MPQIPTATFSAATAKHNRLFKESFPAQPPPASPSGEFLNGQCLWQRLSPALSPEGGTLWVAMGVNPWRRRTHLSDRPWRGRPTLDQSKQEALIKFNSSFYQQSSQFILKRHRPVVGFLGFDVFNEVSPIVPVVRERTVSSLPIGESWKHFVLLDPMRRSYLDIFHKRGERAARMQARQYMHVIQGAIDPI